MAVAVKCMGGSEVLAVRMAWEEVVLNVSEDEETHPYPRLTSGNS